MTALEHQRRPYGEWVTQSAEETFDLGVLFGRSCRGGEIILLDGPLGAGKTIFVKGLASAFGVNPDDVTSPSFTLVNRHNAQQLTLYHLDLYRLTEGPAAAAAVDLDEILEDESAVVVIEWALRLGTYKLPPEVTYISIKGDADQLRHISVAQKFIEP